MWFRFKVGFEINGLACSWSGYEMPEMGHQPSFRQCLMFYATESGIVRTFQSLELAIEAAESLGPDHYIIDRHGQQIWDPERKLLRNEE